MPSRAFSAAEQFEREHVRPAPGRTLIVGSRLYENKSFDRRQLYRDALGVDMLAGSGVDLVHDLELPLPEGIGKFAHIECLSVLEHSRRPWKLAANLERLLIRNGTLHVQAPFVWRVHGYPGDYFRFTTDAIASLFDRVVFSALMYAHVDLKKNNLLASVDVDGHPYFARTEVCGFGMRL